MTKYCEICEKQFLTGNFITHMKNHNTDAILIAILSELIEINERVSK